MASLAATAAGMQLSNPYATRVACENLRLFLAAHDPGQEALLLVGEAPGYRGAAQSGVPLTSTSVLIDSWDDPWDAFGARAAIDRRHRLSSTERRRRRSSGRHALGYFARHPSHLHGNAVPFHPIGATAHSNRSLRRSEVEAGREWLEWLLVIFPNSRPVALGHRATEALNALGIDHLAIRHPSRGGKTQFIEGLQLARRSTSRHES